MSGLLMTRNAACRVCHGTDLSRVFSFGPTPPANAFLKKEELDKPEPTFPLDVYFCGGCGLLQLLDVVSPELLFRNYVYVSSTSPVFVAHFTSFARSVVERFALPPSSLVVDIGSNDGILLKPFKELGMRVLGIDPAVEIARRATEDGIPTVPEFLTPELARSIAEKDGRAALITATNVFAHINDLDALLEAVKILLADEGVFIIEAPYLVDFLDQNLFDTVYHEHLSYFAVRPLQRIWERVGMEIFDVEKVASHGGSLRVFVRKATGTRPVQSSVQDFLRLETERNVGKIQTYHAFAAKVERNKAALRTMLDEIKGAGKRIAGYGAPAKGNTLLNYFGITAETLEYIVDDSPHKQGLYTPGTHIPVVHPRTLEEARPDYLLILAWNFAEPIMKRLGAFSAAGGKFILPVPEPRVV